MTTSKFAQLLRDFVLKLITGILFWFLFPAVYLLVSPLYFYRFCVKWAASALHPDWVGMMNVRDVFVSERMENKRHLASVVSLVFVLKGSPSLDYIRSTFTEKVLLQQDKWGQLAYTKFSHYYEYWMGFAFWKVEDDFSLEHHIRLCEETANADSVSEEQLLLVMSDLTTKPFKPKTSPWEFLIVDNYQPKQVPTGQNNNENSEDGHFAIVFRFHHSLLDGFSVVKLVVENFGGQPRQHTPRPPRRKRPFWAPILQVLDVIANVGYGHFKILFLDYDWHRWHVPTRSGLSCQWHAVVTPSMPFSIARKVAESHKAATSAVLFSTVAGGLRRHLLTEDREKDLPDVLRGYLALPVPSHPLDGMNNCWTFADVPLPIKPKTAAERIRRLNSYFKSLKKSTIPLLIYALVPLYLAVPKWLVNIWGANRTTTIQLSNFPGPRKELNFFDKYAVDDTWFWLPRLRGNSSISVALLTYNGGIRIALTLDTALFPERAQAQKIADAIYDEVMSYKTIHSDEKCLVENVA